MKNGLFGFVTMYSLKFKIARLINLLTLSVISFVAALGFLVYGGR